MMTIQERVREIMLSKDLSDTEKRERLRALIPPDAFKIDNLNKVTRSQLSQLQDGLAVTNAMQRLNAALLKKKQGEH
jgi:hypothetical protein